MKKRKKKKYKIFFWNEGWIEEVEHKLNRSKIEILKDEKKVEMKTKNKLIMEYAPEHVEVRNGNIECLRKINKSRKYKRFVTPHDLVGSSGLTLTTRGKEIHEVSSARHRTASCVKNR